MHRIKLLLVLVTFGVSTVIAQQRPVDSASIVPRFDLSVGYNHVNANAPPGVSNYFGPNGGYVSGAVHVKDWLSVAGEFTGGHASSISMLGQNLTLLTFMGGPRLSFTGHRLVPFGQALFGGAHGSDSYFPTSTSSTSSASSWAFSTGGGLDVNLTRRFAIRAVEAQFMRTAFPNGANNAQNNLMIGAGIVIKFGSHGEVLPAAIPVRQAGELAFTCSSSVANIDQGQTLEIVGHTMTKPDRQDVSYSWSSSGGTIEGSGRRVTINTGGLPAGDYHVTGHASLVSNPSTTVDCETAFRVNQPVATNVASVSARADNTTNEEAFHENVRDALFDYDSYKIRPDAQAAIEHAARYLNDHPSIRVLIGGYSDERGSAEYNLALGENRANAARNALIAAGVAAERLQIISYGKEVQFCTADNETCWQQNRRAAFLLHP
jgi:peptidoglycan-associated lipoprotein